MVFLAFASLSLVAHWRYRLSRIQLRETIAALAGEDAAPIMTTDRDGEIGYVNRAAKDRYGAAAGKTLANVLGDILSQPATVVYRLQNKALALGSAREDIPNRGERVQLSVHRIGEDGFLWRLDELGEFRAAGHAGENIGMPMMTVSRSGTILFLNEALRRLLGGRETSIDRVFTDYPIRNGEVHTIRASQGSVAVQVAEVALSGGRRELYLLPEPERPVIATPEWGLVESLPIPLIKLDRAGTITMANQRARRLLGCESPSGVPFAELVEGLGRPLNDWLDEAWIGRNSGRTETVHARRREEDTFLQVSLERMRGDDGDALVAVLNDATELKTLEGQFVQSQKMQAIGQLAGGVAHDFNNVLTAISGHCDLLLMRHDENDQDFADLKQISQNTNRAAALVGQLLAFSRKQRLRPDVIDLAESMSDLSHLLGRLVGEKVTLEYRHDASVKPVRADKRKLEQVVMNLVVNARDAMPDGGRVRLDVRDTRLDHPMERDRVRVPMGDYVTIRVIDEGQGIAPDRIDKIFEPFYTTKGSKGTGLGLSMAYGIVKQSGGYIFVDSTVGSGTTFVLHFPVHHASKEQGDVALSDPDDAPELRDDAHPEDVAQPHGRRSDLPDVAPPDGEAFAEITDRTAEKQGGNVLLVEDEAPVRAFAARALQLHGYDVIQADSAEAALERLADPAVGVDVIVTDVVMPGMDGPTWVAKALTDRPDVRVVFISGYVEDSVSEQQSRIPNSVFLPKPFSLQQLTATVSGQIHP
ncbi:response regulator [Maritimibacter sp. DP4N28-5]|uniref:histidine kinase n=2 Tax=Maritimibacter dapengensis TaxID=2836868 RepID=A0ABS6T3V7_9RHOB|nr:response regulator [Maritimibacter dapengensis]